jgi:3-hydroxy-D-aspartate aldolase
MAASVIDLDAFERNLRRMADFVGKASARLRAHAKTHKSPIIAARQMEPAPWGCAARKPPQLR